MTRVWLVVGRSRCPVQIRPSIDAFLCWVSGMVPASARRPPCLMEPTRVIDPWSLNLNFLVPVQGGWTFSYFIFIFLIIFLLLLIIFLKNLFKLLPLLEFIISRWAEGCYFADSRYSGPIFSFLLRTLPADSGFVGILFHLNLNSLWKIDLQRIFIRRLNLEQINN